MPNAALQWAAKSDPHSSSRRVNPTESQKHEEHLKKYDPSAAPSASVKLDSDEGERLALVASYHRRKRICLPNERVHAAVHVIVENQLATGEAVVVGSRLAFKTKGLSRHGKARSTSDRPPHPATTAAGEEMTPLSGGFAEIADIRDLTSILFT
jgi:hypothetical protein